MIDVFPNSKLKPLVDMASKESWWSTVRSRRYHTQHGYVPTDAHAATIGAVACSDNTELIKNHSLGSVCVAANVLVLEHGCQYFWITKELCSALLATREPEGKINETPFPFRAFTLLIPCGAIRTKDDGDIAWINVAQAGRNEDGSVNRNGNDCLFIHASSIQNSGAPRDWVSHLTSTKTVDEACGEQSHTIDKISIEVADKLNSMYGWDKDDILHSSYVDPNTLFEEPDVLRALLRLVMNVSYYLTSVPNALEESTVGSEKRTPSGKVPDWWFPRWIGKKYVRREIVSKGGSHNSPRTHWRRGHWRNQAIGEGRQDRRRTWIEPILVMAS